MKTKRRTQVLVVGAGPVGLFTALCLAQRGVRVQIVDKYNRAALYSYALALHSYSLCLLDELGLAENLIEHGHRIGRIALYRDTTRSAEIDLTAVGGPFPFVLALPQTLLESALEHRLRELGVKVQWNNPVIHFQPSRSTIIAFMTKTDASCEDDPAVEAALEEMTRINASYIVGADGFNSFTRRVMGFSFPRVADDQTYQLYEFSAPIVRHDELSVVLRDAACDVLWPLGEDRGRWSFQLDEPGEPDLSIFQRLVDSRVPWFGKAPDELNWCTTVSFERRLADRFGKGRVWLAGDSARLTSPVGVQNMNVGLREAHGLAHRIAEALENDEFPGVLAAYDTERRAEWRKLMGVEPAVEVLPEASAWIAGLAERIVPCLPASGNDLDPLLRQIGLRLR